MREGGGRQGGKERRAKSERGGRVGKEQTKVRKSSLRHAFKMAGGQNAEHPKHWTPRPSSCLALLPLPAACWPRPGPGRSALAPWPQAASSPERASSGGVLLSSPPLDCS
eukprot:4140243-Pyramimonas_sp.AAC.1